MAFDKNDLKVTTYRRASQPILKDGLASYMETEFRKIEDSISSLNIAAPQVAFKEPDQKLLSMIRYAKSPWNPLGTGDGWVYWNGAAWAAL